VPELPEVEITVRRLKALLVGAEVESALAPGIATLKTIDPPLSALEGRELTDVRRAGKLVVIELGDLSLLLHLMAAGRFDLPPKRGSLRDRRLRLVLRLSAGRELRLREYGTRQRAWAKVLPTSGLATDETLARLGPDAWPAPALDELAQIVAEPRHLHPLLRDQHVIAGIGRSWVDELLWASGLSPFRQGADLEPFEVELLRHACDEVLGEAIDHYEREIGDTLPQKFPMPLKVHGRQGTPCPRCGTRLEAVHFKEHVTTYCPEEQTGGRVLKDRRLSRLLK
jgi:formamidopyrimidine-DNA glycosylase